MQTQRDIEILHVRCLKSFIDCLLGRVKLTPFKYEKSRLQSIEGRVLLLFVLAHLLVMDAWARHGSLNI